MRKFTPKEDNYLLKNHCCIPAKRMAKKLGRSEGTARQRMKLLGIVVPPEIVEIFKQESRFKKGQQPANKGKKITEYMSSRGIANSKKTRFKKGHLPANTKKDLEISVRTDNRGIKYKWIRISLGKWMPLHRYVWEQSSGPISPSLKLVFKDNNPMNCALENLELVTSAELMRRNSYHYKYPIEIRQAIQLGGALTRKINSKIKMLKNEK